MGPHTPPFGAGAIAEAMGQHPDPFHPIDPGSMITLAIVIAVVVFCVASLTWFCSFRLGDLLADLRAWRRRRDRRRGFPVVPRKNDR